MTTKPLCIYHAFCADGFGAAWVVRHKLGADVDFYAASYGEEPPDVAGRDVIMVDFSYKRPVLDSMMEVANSILILDHHKTAQEDLADIPPPFGPTWYRHNVVRDRLSKTLYALFDMERSGAGIAWDFFFPVYHRPPLIDRLEDRDLWRFQYEDTRAVQASVSSYPHDFNVWDRLMTMLLSSLRAEGEAIDRKHRKDVVEMVDASKRSMTIGGHVVPVANLSYTLASDAGHLMAQGQPFAACYVDTPTGRIFSLRSTDAGIDVSEIAKSYGGGGHRNAAGFKKLIGWEGDPT